LLPLPPLPEGIGWDFWPISPSSPSPASSPSPCNPLPLWNGDPITPRCCQDVCLSLRSGTRRGRLSARQGPGRRRSPRPRHDLHPCWIPFGYRHGGNCSALFNMSNAERNGIFEPVLLDSLWNKAPVDHVDGGLHGARTESVQGFVARVSAGGACNGRLGSGAEAGCNGWSEFLERTDCSVSCNLAISCVNCSWPAASCSMLHIICA
jgi:hypothetical protein